MGMLTTVAYILAMDTFGPITDNAGGIAEMSEAPEETRRHHRRARRGRQHDQGADQGLRGWLGGAGRVPALLGLPRRGQTSSLTSRGRPPFQSVDLAKVAVFIGGFLGAMLVFLFSSLAIRAVGKAAGAIIEEVRRQFRETPASWPARHARTTPVRRHHHAGRAQRDGRCRAARGGVPVVVGLVLKAEAAAALLMVGTMGGILMATVLNNSGGTWDNAKKFIESGKLRGDNGEVLGKRTDAHAAAVVGDTVGDPFKDTAGPSLHVLIKLLARSRWCWRRSSFGSERTERGNTNNGGSQHTLRFGTRESAARVFRRRYRARAHESR